MDWIVTLVDNMPAFFIFMAIATSFVPLPDFPIILNLASTGSYPAWLIGLIGGWGTCVAGLIDYLIVTEIRKISKVDELLKNKYYVKVEKYFTKVGFVSLMASGFLIFIPFDPFKFIAATSRYSKTKYIVAIFLGRAPRYYLLALLGEEVHFSPTVLSVTFIIFALIPFGQYIYKRVKKKRELARVSLQK